MMNISLHLLGQEKKFGPNRISRNVSFGHGGVFFSKREFPRFWAS
jgi:hypothetical protein